MLNVILKLYFEFGTQCLFTCCRVNKLTRAEPEQNRRKKRSKEHKKKKEVETTIKQWTQCYIFFKYAMHTYISDSIVCEEQKPK